MENSNLEFKVFNKSIETIACYYGLFLMIWGIIISFLSKSTSLTSYIPSYLGFFIFTFSLLSIKFPNKKKMIMHLVALLGLITFLGGLDIIRLFIKSNLFNNFWADLSKIMMLVTGFLFVFLCFKSFRHARSVSSEQTN